MKIIYHHRTMGDGAEGIHIREMVLAFRSLGHEVMVVGPTGEPRPDESVNKANISILCKIKDLIPPIVYDLIELSYTPYCVLQMLRKIKSFKPDFIYDRYITFNAGPVLAGIISNTPVILEVNAPLALERSKESDEKVVFKRLAFFMEQKICSKANYILSVSSPLRDYLIASKVSEKNVHVLPNGANPEKFFPRRKPNYLLNKVGVNGCQIIIGFSGILRKWHGVDLLISAFLYLIEKNMNLYLLIVGDGPERCNIEKQLAQVISTNKYHITGRIPHSQVVDYINLFDIAVSPKSTFYASPMKVLEYMAMGKAVLVPDRPNFRDLITPGKTGLTFMDGSPEDLARNIKALCENREQMRTIGENARQRILNRYNWQWNANYVCSLI